MYLGGSIAFNVSINTQQLSRGHAPPATPFCLLWPITFLVSCLGGPTAEILALGAHRCLRDVLQRGVGVWQTQDILTRETEVGATKPCTTLPMDLTKEINFMQQGLSEPALTRGGTFKKVKICAGQGWSKKNHQLFPFCHSVFILQQYASTHSLQIFGWFCWRHFCAVQCRTRQMFYCCLPRLSGTKANNDCLIAHMLSLCSATLLSEFSIYGSCVFFPDV